MRRLGHKKSGDLVREEFYLCQGSGILFQSHLICSL